MAQGLVMCAVAGLQPAPWHIIAIGSVFTCIGIFFSVRAWQGRAISASGNMETETRFRIFIVTTLPCAVFFLGLTVFGLLTHVHGELGDPVLKVLLFIAELVSVLVATKRTQTVIS